MLRRKLEELRQEEGATTVEFLATMVFVLGLMVAIIQITLVFVNAIMANHALSLAANEAGNRGGMIDPNTNASHTDPVRITFVTHLPAELQGQCGGSGGAGAIGLNCLTSSRYSNGIPVPGQECLGAGQPFALSYTFSQPLPLLRVLGINKTITLHRSLTVASQSLNKTTRC